MLATMRPDIEKSLGEIKKYYIGKTTFKSPYEKAINKEFEEWISDSFEITDNIWSLPDLTRIERYENFCRSIRKKIN